MALKCRKNQLPPSSVRKNPDGNTSPASSHIAHHNLPHSPPTVTDFHRKICSSHFPFLYSTFSPARPTSTLKTEAATTSQTLLSISVTKPRHSSDGPVPSRLVAGRRLERPNKIQLTLVQKTSKSRVRNLLMKMLQD